MLKQKWRKISFRKKLVILVSLFLFSMSIAAIIQFEFVMTKLKTSQVDNYSSFSEALSISISAQFYERYGDVQAFAKNEILKSFKKSEIQNVLNSYVQLYGIYDLILFVDSSGKLIAANNVGVDGKVFANEKLFQKNYADQKWFINSMAGRFTSDVEKGFNGTYFEDVMIDPVSSFAYDEKKLGTSFSSVVKDNNDQVIGVITNRANFKWVENEVLNYYSELRKSGHTGIEINIINNQGKVLLDLDIEEKEIPKIVERDFDSLLKDDYFKLNYLPAMKTKNGFDGSMISKDQRHPIYQAVGYSRVKGAKFIDSIGWSVFVREPVETIFASHSSARWIFYGLISACFLISIILLMLFSKKLISELFSVTLRLDDSVESNIKISSTMNESSLTLSNASQEQAAAIQESVSALSEISSMISQTSNNSKSALNAAEQAKDKAIEGQQIMSRMINSMNSIQRSNDQLQSIKNVIESIKVKTQVINDIVFKTQLLSFNASIEAARAGQHGRGFAVVAEEVGSLAQLSGQASQDIEILLGDSQQNVEETLEVIRNRVREGIHVSDEAQKAFNDIAGKVEDMNHQIKLIEEATTQQELGIQQTNIAMKQMDESAQTNSRSALEVSRLSEDLSMQNTTLKNVMESLNLVILGTRKFDKNSINQKETDFDNFPEKKQNENIDLVNYVSNKLKESNSSRAEPEGSEKNNDEVDLNKFDKAV